jgi:hypothetical protein
MFDEVRRMSIVDIERAEERLSHSSLKNIVRFSTPEFPGNDIHHFFLKTDQRHWHSTCQCSDGVVLSDVFPECVISDDKDREAYYICPKCRVEISDPQDGQYVAHNRSADKRGYTFAQTLSRFITPAAILNAMLTAVNKREVYNSKLGRPYMDPDAIIVSEAHLNSECVDPQAHWTYDDGGGYLGCDQRGGEFHVVVKRVKPTGEHVTVHLEVIQATQPFHRLVQIMRQMRIDVAVVDAMPNINDAHEFCKEFPGWAFCSHYVEAQSGKNLQMIRFRDRFTESEDTVFVDPEAKFEYAVLLDRYQILEYTLNRWKKKLNLVPSPLALTQDMFHKARFGPIHLCKELYFYHLTRVAREKIEVVQHLRGAQPLDTGRFRMVFKNLGNVDPHFLHADAYAEVAIARIHGTTIFYADPPKPILSQFRDHGIEQRMARPQLRCSDCHYIPRGCVEDVLCEYRRITVKGEQPKCELFMPRVGQ